MIGILFSILLAAHGPATLPRIDRTDGSPMRLHPLPFRTTGRAIIRRDHSVLRQWPGTYFEVGFRGTRLYFRVGSAEADFSVRVDGGPPQRLPKPAAGMYRVAGLSAGRHRLRIDIISETKAVPTTFDGFFAEDGIVAQSLLPRRRSIEFVGDSHTVGYANRSHAITCSDDVVRATTDTSAGVAALTAARLDADYQVLAVSGRGVVRNYDGAVAPTVPELYPHVLLDRTSGPPAMSWRPQVIVVSLGTNDFSTPLHADEKWVSRETLRTDFDNRYIRFVGELRRLHPRAYILLWVTDFGNGQIATEVTRVAEKLRASDQFRVGFVRVRGLRFAACNSHPDLADDILIADALARHLRKRLSSQGFGTSPTRARHGT